MTPRVVIADDHPVFRHGLRAVLAADGVDVVADVASGAEAVAAAREHTPDVVLMDLAMPGGDGLEATREIGAVAPQVAVLVLTMSEDDDALLAAMRAGARGYLVKGTGPEEIGRAVRSVADGELIVGARMAARLTSWLTRPGAVGGDPFPELTARERDVLDLVARGRSNEQIARVLGLSAKTVRNHVSNVLTKLRVTGRAEAIVRAREAGLG
jgi:DNA-binding NarL/FixJ family response regulator